MTFQSKLQTKLVSAFQSLDLELPEGFSPEIAISADVRHGDYQANAAMALAKRMRMNPRELATQVVDALADQGVGELASMEIAGPGFINFRILKSAWSEKVESLLHDERHGVPLTDAPQNIVVDFSAPNVAKPMHVGHIRSTIIGDSLSRISRFLGHNVITDNHIGDWGTQFGMVIYGWKNLIDQDALKADPLQELLRIYREVNKLCKADETILENL